MCGSSNNGYDERRQPVSLSIPHTSDSLTMRVKTSLDQSGSDERYARAMASTVEDEAPAGRRDHTARSLTVVSIVRTPLPY